MASTMTEREVISRLNNNWVWVPNWADASDRNSAGRIVTFTRRFHLPSTPKRALCYFSADTRYKLYVNGARVAVGPTRGSPALWYYDNLDFASKLKQGHNEVVFVVVRYFASTRAAMPFERTMLPGLTVVGTVESDDGTVSLDASQGWEAQVDDSIIFPIGLIDDGFLHISERKLDGGIGPIVAPKPYRLNTLNGDLLPWRLQPRPIPLHEENRIAVKTVRNCQSSITKTQWESSLLQTEPVLLPAKSSHTLEIQADVHSTAFLRWTFQADRPSQIKMKVTYSEGYEHDPRDYPFFRSKGDRLDAARGHLIGPFDEVILDIQEGGPVIYEPFWFRTFRVLRLEITTGSEAVELSSFHALQANYPLEAKSFCTEPEDPRTAQIWEVSVRTMRNCMFDGYSDCPFYEQLQYSGDSRSVGLFHYLLSGDDRLMRQSIVNFAASVTYEGLTQSRFPSHVPQIIAGFSLYWILQVCDHHLFFADQEFARSFLPRIDGVLLFFESHINENGLVSDLPDDVWQFVDWVKTWGATEQYPDKGVPTSGRRTNLHTYFSLLYAYVLRQAARLVRDAGRPAHACEYEMRAVAVNEAVRAHCYDGKFFTDSTSDVADNLSYSQHCQVFAVLSGASKTEDCARILHGSFSLDGFSKCSYMMKFYAFRAFAIAGDDVYESFWHAMWEPYRNMLTNNLTTWEEDDVRQRSDCHAWGSVPIYEYCTELAGVKPIAPGSAKILFKPRLRLASSLRAKVAVGRSNVATVSWERSTSGGKIIELQLERSVEVVSKLPNAEEVDHGLVDKVVLIED